MTPCGTATINLQDLFDHLHFCVSRSAVVAYLGWVRGYSEADTKASRLCFAQTKSAESNGNGLEDMRQLMALSATPTTRREEARRLGYEDVRQWHRR